MHKIAINIKKLNCADVDYFDCVRSILFHKIYYILFTLFHMVICTFHFKLTFSTRCIGLYGSAQYFRCFWDCTYLNRNLCNHSLNLLVQLAHFWWSQPWVRRRATDTTVVLTFHNFFISSSALDVHSSWHSGTVAWHNSLYNQPSSNIGAKWVRDMEMTLSWLGRHLH